MNAGFGPLEERVNFAERTHDAILRYNQLKTACQERAEEGGPKFISKKKLAEQALAEVRDAAGGGVPMVCARVLMQKANGSPNLSPVDEVVLPKMGRRCILPPPVAKAVMEAALAAADDGRAYSQPQLAAEVNAFLDGSVEGQRLLKYFFYIL